MKEKKKRLSLEHLRAGESGEEDRGLSLKGMVTFSQDVNPRQEVDTH